MQMKNILGKFPYSTIYLILLSAGAFIVWQYHLEDIGIPIYLGLLFFVYLFSKDTMMSIPILFNAFFMFGKGVPSFDSIPWYLFAVPIVLIGGMIIHSIIYKVKLWRGKMLVGILLMVAAMILSSLNAVEVTMYYYFYASIGILYAIFYLFYRNTFFKDHTAYLLKMMFVLGILVSAEVISFYFGVDDIVYAIEHRTIFLGWGLSNYIATYLIMFSAISFYFAKTKKFTFFYLLVALVEGILTIFTGSRGGMFAYLLLLPILLILLFVKSKKKYITFLNLVLITDIVLIVSIIHMDIVQSLFDRFLNIGFDDNGRYAIWQNGYNIFISHPLFGGGLFARTDTTMDYGMFHNTFLQTAATLGSIGLVALVIQLWQQITIPLKGWTNESIFLVAALLGAHAHGMIDNVYYMPQFMLIMLVIVAVTEIRNEFIYPKSFEKILRT